MTQQTRTTNKGRFEQGDTPQGSDYIDLIDSYVTLADTTAQTMTSDLSVPTLIATEVSGNRGNFGTVIVSGTSTFTRGVICSASAHFSGPTVVSGTSQIYGSLRHGASGFIQLVQTATLISSHSAGAPATFSFPANSDIQAIYLDIEAPFLAGTMNTAQRIGTYIGGTGVSAASLVSEIGVSASGQYNLLRTPTVAGNHTLLRNVALTLNVFASTKALASAATAGQGMISIMYIQRA